MNRSIDDDDHVIVLMVIIIFSSRLFVVIGRFLLSMLILHCFEVSFLVAVVHIVYEL